MNSVFEDEVGSKRALKVPCHLCVNAKAHCDNERPCSRCIQTGQATLCSDQSIKLPKLLSAFEEVSDKPSDRVKSACADCIKAKAKCDQDRPCSRCVKRNNPQLCQDREEEKNLSEMGVSVFELAPDVTTTISSGKTTTSANHNNNISNDDDDENHSESTRPRVGLACANCVKAKTKCDTNRPCERCSRKGIEHLCVDRSSSDTPQPKKPKVLPCQPCTDNHRICDGKRPCSSCQGENNLVGCVDSVQKRQSDSRTKIACGKCFEAKTKCDNGRPCSRCVKKKIPELCQDRPRKRSTKNSSGDSSSSSTLHHRTKKACIHCSRAKTKCDTERPCRRCVRKNMAAQCTDRTDHPL